MKITHRCLDMVGVTGSIPVAPTRSSKGISPIEARQAGVRLWDEARRINKGTTRLPRLMGRPPRQVDPMPDGSRAALMVWGRRNILGEE